MWLKFKFNQSANSPSHFLNLISKKLWGTLKVRLKHQDDVTDTVTDIYWHKLWGFHWLSVVHNSWGSEIKWGESVPFSQQSFADRISKSTQLSRRRLKVKVCHFKKNDISLKKKEVEQLPRWQRGIFFNLLPIMKHFVFRSGHYQAGILSRKYDILKVQTDYLGIYLVIMWCSDLYPLKCGWLPNRTHKMISCWITYE